MVKVIDAGFLTTIQDQPRRGLARYGLSEAGPMAPMSFLEANYLAGNSTGMPSLEVTMKPPRILFRESTRIGLAGADFGWKLDNRPLPLGRTIEVRPGATLQGDYCRSGLRGYISFQGGLAVSSWNGSAATHVQSKLGGMVIQRGDEIGLNPAANFEIRQLREHSHSPLYSGASKVLRVVDGPHLSLFAPEAISLLTGTIYRVTEYSSRMALRLDGLAVPSPKDPLPSCGAWHGAIQVPPSGIPQVLGVDHPATGGYPILASVIRADFETFGQLRPREEIRFGRVSIETARQLLKRQAEWWQAQG